MRVIHSVWAERGQEIALFIIFYMKENKLYLKITGFAVLAISFVLFLLIPVVPFLGYPAKKAGAIAAGLLIAGEILFYTSLFILGRSFWDRIKSKLSFLRKKKKETELSV